MWLTWVQVSTMYSEISHCGRLLTKNLTESQPEWDQTLAFKKAYDPCCTYQIKYRNILSRLATRFSLGQDQYPMELTSATNVLSNNYKCDLAYYKSKEKKKLKDRLHQKD